MADLVIDVGQLEAKPWPTLREDLVLLEGPRAYGGSPTWTLYDPSLHSYYRIGWLEFECLHRWELADSEQIASAIHHETPINAESGDVEKFREFIVNNQLAKPNGAESSRYFAFLQEKAKRGIWTWLLHNYLFMRIPLVKPDRYLQKLLPVIDLFFHPVFVILLVLGFLLAVALVARNWSEFSHSFMYSFTPEGLIATLGMMSLSKMVHEMGHAFAASHYGCRVPAMGVALLVGMPVLWTDATDAWRLPNRRHRLTIDAAGMIAEFTLAITATILWTVLPDGPVRSGAYLLASTAWVITLAINVNPFMRFDGYYLLSDAFDIPNLQNRSFYLACWWMREKLFGFGLEPPEQLPAKQRRGMMLYAVSVWIYRLVLFIGIAWLVYYFFFKALGLFLFIVEIGWFILRPIANEVSKWRELLKEHHVPLHFRPAWLVPMAILLLLFIPWKTHIIVPGLFRAAAEHTLYCVESAEVKDVLVNEGDWVKANQVIAKLDSPDVNYKILAAQLKLEELMERFASQSLELKLAQHNPMDYEELQSTKAELVGLRGIKDKLTVRATFDGRVRDLSEWLKPGEWLAKDEPIGIVENSKGFVIAYAEEADLAKLEIGNDGKFYSDGGDLSPFEVKVIAIDRTGTRDLKVEELASNYGGGIAVRPSRTEEKNEDKKLVPEQGIYRLLMETDGAINWAENEKPINARGRLSIATASESIAGRLFRSGLVTLVKESGW